MAGGAYLERSMPSSLRNRLSDLAASFSAAVLGAIRGSSLEELVVGSRGKAAGPSRPTPRMPVATPARAPAISASPAPRPGPRKGGRLPRRSAGDISNALDQIVGLLKQSASGLRAEQIREKLGLEAKELPRPLKEGVEAGRLSKVGQKRATTYFAVGAGGAEAGAKVAVRAAARRARSSSSAKGGKASAPGKTAKTAKPAKATRASARAVRAVAPKRKAKRKAVKASAR
jgi:hypothetical protein